MNASPPERSPSAGGRWRSLDVLRGAAVGNALALVMPALRSADTLRLMGVLQRIALSFGAAAAVVWLLGAAHPYQGEGLPFDHEGLASTAPAIAQVLLGW